MENKILNRLFYKLWFLFDLPAFIKQNRFKSGAELGAKAGRSMYHVLRRNPEVTMIGLDMWEPQAGSTYSKNQQNEDKCRNRLRPYKDRVTLYKGYAQDIADNVQDKSLDFVFYDLYNHRVSTYDLHAQIIKKWAPKLRDNGFFIGRDFHTPELKKVIEDMGYQIQDCVIGKRKSVRLKFFVRTPDAVR